MKIRLTYHPRHATVMPNPSRRYNRAANLGGMLSTGGLDRMHKGVVSLNARRKMKVAIDWLCAAAQPKQLYSKRHKKFFTFKLTFLTLTIPNQNGLSDRQVKQVFNAWLQTAKYLFGLKNYVWKAELQKRGAVHIHLTSDCFMWHATVRHSWNRLLKKYSLLGGHVNPNSTDIHSTYKVKNMAAYLFKYMSKGSASDSVVDGRLWGCSRMLSQAYGVRLLSHISNSSAENAVLRSMATYVKEMEYCNYYSLNEGWYLSLPDCPLKSIINARLNRIAKPNENGRPELWCYDTGCLMEVEKPN